MASGIELDRTLHWTTANADEAAMLDDLQVNILDGHGRRSTLQLFLQFSDAEKGREFIRKLAPLVTSAAEQLRQAKYFHDTGIPGPPIIGLLLSHAGYRALGAEPKAPLADDDGAFRDGMKTRDILLGDNPGSVEDAYREDIHALVLIGAEPDGPNQWGSLAAQSEGTKVLNLLGNAGRVIKEEIGRAIFRDNGPLPVGGGRKIEGIEHFGYVDGRSQPLVLAELVDRERDEGGGISVWDPAFPLAQVLVPDPGSGQPNAFGSFFVFRKLGQNVAAFKAAEEKLGDKLGIGELAGALLVGRFEDGTPVTLQQDESADKPVSNNFDYASDQKGLRCPFHAHIRKTNPRGDTVSLLGASLESERSHIMARRGMTYGERDKIIDPSDLPTGEVGLMFMSFQANLRDQFEFTQASWANSTQFVSDFAGKPAPGRDPIIGQRGGNPAAPVQLRNEWGKQSAHDHAVTFEEHVVFKGGEYFFAPAKSTLATL